MTPQQIVGLAARLFAIWLIVAMFHTFGTVSAFGERLGHATRFEAYFSALWPLALAVVLWFFPMFVAHKLVPRTHDANTLRMPAREATAAASAIIGMWILVAMFPRLVAEGGVMFLGGGVRFMATYFTPDTTVYLITLLLQCAAGFFLLAKPWFVASKVFPEADHIGNDAE